ncbi:MAG TPA: FecR family protein, partial [Terriglobia bacterium]|nr:FecR family protein [Terriglobia bacterium]
MKKVFLSAGIGLLFAMMLALPASVAGKEEGYSHVRVVRLSFVEGAVLVKRPGSSTWAKAAVNTPIQQGFSVSTSTGSFAEVQFENGSTARLGQLSQLDFNELALDPKGAKINQMALAQGYATFHLNPKHGDLYTVKAADTTLTPHGKTEFRTDLTQGELRVEVFDGSVQAASPTKSAKVTKGKILETNTAPQETAFNISHDIKKDAWDNWVHERDQQAELALNEGAVGIRSNVYGWSDLDTYGEWAYFPGFGYGWSPFVPAGWAPFSAGQWSWYSGLGYTWISSEPWGWLPFHYGFWNYAPGFGYFWMPPSHFNAWNPGIVSWYSGPGYVGWAARNASGAPVCRSSIGCVTAVKTTAFQNGVPVNSTSRVAVNSNQLSRVATPPVSALAGARLSGTPAAHGVVYPGMPGGMTPQQYSAATHARITASHAVPSAAVQAPVAHARRAANPRAFTAAARAATPAPNIVLMGQSRQAGARNASAHESFLGRTFGSHGAEALRPQLGNTLGGQYRVGPNASRMPSALENQAMRQGAVRGVQPRFGASPTGRSSNPVFLNRRNSPGFSGAAPRMGNRGIQMQRGRTSAPPPNAAGSVRSAPRMSAPPR